MASSAYPYTSTGAAYPPTTAPSSIPRANGSHRRQGSTARPRSDQMFNFAYDPSAMPSAPDVPRGPPIAYKPPFPPIQDPAQPTHGRRSFSARDAGSIPFNTNVNPQEGSARRVSIHNAPPSSHVRRAEPPAMTPTAPTSDTRRFSQAEPKRQPQAANAPQRVNTVKSASGKGKGRDWTDDRSPLQKLELTLNDISKEEKRARVEEAEMLLREKQAGRARARAKQDPSTNLMSSEYRQSGGSVSRKEAKDLEEAGLVRSLSGKQRDRLQNSITVESRKDNPARRSAEGRAPFAYEEQEYIKNPKTRAVSNPVRQPPQESRHRPVSYGAAQDYGQSRVAGPRPMSYDAQPQAVPAEQHHRHHHAVAPAAAAALGAGALYEAERHRHPTSTTHNESFGRSNSRKLQKDPPIGYEQAYTSAKHTQGLGVRHSDEQVTSDARPRSSGIAFSGNQTSPRALTEWKTASTARLLATDFDLRDSNRNKAWWEDGGAVNSRRGSRAKEALHNARSQEELPGPTSFRPNLYMKCGPLLRYTGMRKDPGGRGVAERETWRGTVLIVTKDSASSYETVPTLRLFSQPTDLLPPPPHRVGEELAPEYVDPIAGLTKSSRTGQTLYVRPVHNLPEHVDLSQEESDEGLFEKSPSPINTNGHETILPNDRTRGKNGELQGKFAQVKGFRLHADPSRDVTFWRFNIEIELTDKQEHVAYRINRGPAIGFWVPARGQSMNIMFHSCNGFSLSVDPNHFSGPDPLWRDVLNTHQTQPFHVMIGGGDQLYNDKVTVETELFQDWLHIRNPHEKRKHPFSPEMKAELETFYLERYCLWFSQGLFGLANSQIPMVNIYDDHDIIDGYGSYPDHFMSSPVFVGLGGIAFKYYMLFQHQSVPEETSADEPSWQLGVAPGPYIKQRSRSVFMHMGKSVAFLGLDCRTERTREQIMTQGSYDAIFDRCHHEIIQGETRHLIVLLGVPIAYPRLVWLENLLTSRIMDPVKAVGRTGILGGFLNKFDGGVEILDDLDDHWTAKNHKDERKWFIEELQDLAVAKSVRITILGGDVHLAAIGQFYSNPKFRIPKDRDYRYMPNIISSAIVNTPPPEMMADVLNKRNKVHWFDKDTCEDMIPIFTHDVNGQRRNNKRLLPRRNWCSIREYLPGSTPPPTPPLEETPMSTPGSEQYPPGRIRRSLSLTRGDSRPANLLRRLSGRNRRSESVDEGFNGPPTTHHRAFDNQADQAPVRPPPSTSFNTHRDSYFPPQSSQPTHDLNRSSSLPTTRPNNFQRRPTTLSMKKAKRGGAVENADIDDHINLEGGLDITLNCEATQADPAGITVPYRLLVPRLWYRPEEDILATEGAHLRAGEQQQAKKGGLLRGFSLRRKPEHEHHHHVESNTRLEHEVQHESHDSHNGNGNGNQNRSFAAEHTASGALPPKTTQQQYYPPPLPFSQSQSQHQPARPLPSQPQAQPRAQPLPPQNSNRPPSERSYSDSASYNGSSSGPDSGIDEDEYNRRRTGGFASRFVRSLSLRNRNKARRREEEEEEEYDDGERPVDQVFEYQDRVKVHERGSTAPPPSYSTHVVAQPHSHSQPQPQQQHPSQRAREEEEEEYYDAGIPRRMGSNRLQKNQRVDSGGSGKGQQDWPLGYSGVEAYKERKRRWF